MSWGLRAPVLPAHPQQAAEICLPVHRRLLIRGGGGETLRVRLQHVFLSPSASLPLGLQLSRGGTAAWGPLEIQSEEAEAGEKAKEEENIKYIVK